MAAGAATSFLYRALLGEFLRSPEPTFTTSLTMLRPSLRAQYYQESGPLSYMRKTLAMRLMAANGVPVSQTRYIRLFENGAFEGLYLLVEMVDKRACVRRLLRHAAPSIGW